MYSAWCACRSCWLAACRSPQGDVASDIDDYLCFDFEPVCNVQQGNDRCSYVSSLIRGYLLHPASRLLRLCCCGAAALSATHDRTGAPECRELHGQHPHNPTPTHACTHTRTRPRPSPRQALVRRHRREELCDDGLNDLALGVTCKCGAGHQGPQCDNDLPRCDATNMVCLPEMCSGGLNALSAYYGSPLPADCVCGSSSSAQWCSARCLRVLTAFPATAVPPRQ